MKLGHSQAPGTIRHLRRQLRRYALVLGVLAGLAAAPAIGDTLDAADVRVPVQTAQHTVAEPTADPTPEGGQPAAVAATAAGAAIELPTFTHRSARLEDVARRPVALRIDALDISAAVTPIGSDASGNLDVPQDAGAVAWYEAGSVPGAAGSAVLAGHVDYNGLRGVFFNLDQLHRGDPIVVSLDDGTTMTFEVTRRNAYDKAALPTTELFTGNGPPVLTLITCGGDFDSTTRHYTANTIVQAALRS